MSYLKPSIDIDEVISFLKGRSIADLESLSPIGEGQTAQAYCFQAGTDEYVIRISTELAPFEKEQYAAQHFNSSAVPIPAVHEVGRFDGKHFYAISDRKPGKTLEQLGDGMFQSLLPAFLDVLDAIHATPIESRQLTGWWEGKGEAADLNWHSYILSVTSVDRYHWRRLLAEGRVDKDLVEETYAEICRLITYCPQPVQLIHGDYGLHNILSDGRSITGVIDWENSKFGDSIYDIAWVDFWSPTFKFPELYYKRCQERRVELHNYHERLRCYALHVGLEMLDVHAWSGQQVLQDWNCGRLRALLNKY